MSNFVEFQALVLDKLCSLENRLSSIESVLGINNDNVIDNTQSSSPTEFNIESDSNSVLKDEINEFRDKLTEIKTFLSTSEY